MVKSTSKEAINPFGKFSAPPPRHPQAIVLICKFNGDRTSRHNTFSLFIKRAKPETIEHLFKELGIRPSAWA